MSGRGAHATPRLWAARAAVVERAVHSRHLRRLSAMPGTLLGVVAWPPSAADRCHVRWDYWWQAHLLDCLVDAHLRGPSAPRRSAVERVVRGIHRRNAGRWTNEYYDDMAWLGLALLRADRYAGVPRPDAVRALAEQLRAGWTDDAGGGIWWRRNDDFKNVPANGPAAILLARLADEDGPDGANRRWAAAAVDWIEQHLLDPDTGLVWDGLHVDAGGAVREVEKAIYTYGQGVYLGACVELARREGPDAAARIKHAVRTVDAVAVGLTDPDVHGPVLRGQGGGDGGLFAGILARYLTLAAIELPMLDAGCVSAARTAADLVYVSAEAAWRNRAIAPGGPLFGPDWTVPAVQPRRTSRPERDLSVQVGGWMLMEAAAALEAAEIPAPDSLRAG